MEPALVLATGNLTVKYHVATALFTLVTTPTLLANVLLLFIVFRDTNFRDISTMLVTFISIADLMYVIYMCSYITIQYVLHDVSDIVCTVVITTQSVLRMVPNVTFILIAYNWYLAKFKPAVCYKFHQIPNISLKCFLATWAVSIITCTGVPFLVCDHFKEVAFLAYSGLSFAAQLIVLVIEAYLHIKNILKTFNELEPEKSTKVKKSKNTLLQFNIKITKVFLFLSLVYFVFSAPLLLYPFFEFVLGVKSSPFAIFLYHLLSSFPCLMNPICLYIISQKFQEELRSIFGIENPKKNPTDKPNPIMAEAFSANTGFFQPRTPNWRQDDEYQNREVIYGEYPSVAPTKAKTKSKGKGKKKDVRFCDLIEEVAPNTPGHELSTTSPTLVKTPLPESPRLKSPSKLTSPPITSRVAMPTNNTLPQVTPRNPGRLIAALDLGSKDKSLSGSWPRSQTSPYSSFQEIDLSCARLGPTSLLQQNKQFKRNLIKRSKSMYHPRRGEDASSPSTSAERDEVWRTVSTTTRTVQVHIQDVCEEVMETYL